MFKSSLSAGFFQTTSCSELETCSHPACLRDCPKPLLLFAVVCDSTRAAPHPKICCRSSFFLTDLFGPTSPARPLALFPADDLVFSLWLCALKLCGKGAPTVPGSCEPDPTCPSLHIRCFFIICEYVAVQSVFTSFVCHLESAWGNLTAIQSCLTK